MPIGLVVPVVLVGWATACALTSWRRLGGVARVPALLLNNGPAATDEGANKSDEPAGPTFTEFTLNT